VQINNTGKDQVVVKLYEGLLRFIKIARISIEKKDIEAKGIFINKSITIVTELNCALDRSLNSELVMNLEDIYSFCLYALTTANMKNDMTILDDLIRVIEPLYNAWKEISKTNTSTLPMEETKRGLKVTV
jgi:flagellar protein FliS